MYIVFSLQINNSYRILFYYYTVIAQESMSISFNASISVRVVTFSLSTLINIYKLIEILF